MEGELFVVLLAFLDLTVKLTRQQSYELDLGDGPSTELCRTHSKWWTTLGPHVRIRQELNSCVRASEVHIHRNKTHGRLIRVWYSL